MYNRAVFSIILTSSSLLYSITSAAPLSMQERSDCPAGLTYLDYNRCSSGFVGCGVPSQCDGSSRFITNASGSCPSGLGMTFHRCSDPKNPDLVFWSGCTAESDVCDTILRSLSSTPLPKPEPTPEPLPPVTKEPIRKCPVADTWYNPEGGCPSGFVGCMGRKDYCSGEKRFWGTCPAELGNYYVCSNGFKGCSTDVNICSKPKFDSE